MSAQSETSNEKYEYRIVWQREGLGPAIAIRQTEKGALAKRDHLLWAENDAKHQPESAYEGETYYSRLPRLTRLEIYFRKVESEWTPLFVVPLEASA